VVGENNMRLKTPLALGLLQAAALAARETESGNIGSQIISGFAEIPSGGIGLIAAVIIVFVAALAIGFVIGSR